MNMHKNARLTPKGRELLIWSAPVEWSSLNVSA